MHISQTREDTLEELVHLDTTRTTLQATHPTASEQPACPTKQNHHQGEGHYNQVNSEELCVVAFSIHTLCPVIRRRVQLSTSVTGGLVAALLTVLDTLLTHRRLSVSHEHTWQTRVTFFFVAAGPAVGLALDTLISEVS